MGLSRIDMLLSLLYPTGLSVFPGFVMAIKRSPIRLLTGPGQAGDEFEFIVDQLDRDEDRRDRDEFGEFNPVGRRTAQPGGDRTDIPSNVDSRGVLNAAADAAAQAATEVCR